jgi:ATP-binding cassette subfamily F protein 3
MLQLHNISKVFPHGEPLREVTWELKPGDRIGIVGANGCGKTTLFRIITGEVEPTTGQVISQPGLKIGYLTQEFDVVPTNTLHDELLRAFVELNAVQAKLRDVEHGLETAEGDEMHRLIKEMDKLHRLQDSLGGYEVHVQVDKLLPTLGFKPEDSERIVSSFSGGWQMRIAFGKLMLQNPDIMLLDEPTNHIDLETVEWLEGYLKTQTKPMAIVSHDRMFLDRVCTKILEIERGKAMEYLGNYSQYVEQKQLNRQAQQAAFDRQQEELERQQAFVDRFRASATRSTQAKSREKQLEKIELIDEPESELNTLEFHFPPAQRSGREVLNIRNLMHGYEDNIVFMDATLEVERGDRIALLGPNGSGKSTLLRLIMKHEQPLDGSVKLGEYNVYPAYFAQNQAEALDLSITVHDTIREAVLDWKDSEVRGLLGRFMFSGDTVFKRVGDLSGGEKARVALAKMLLSTANFLILDEPTNHLDIPAKETLERALKQYEGAVMVVSHDRYFISQIATKIVEIRDNGFKVYEGGYEYYQQRKEYERSQAQAAKEAAELEAQAAAKRAKAKEKERLKKEKARGS